MAIMRAYEIMIIFDSVIASGRGKVTTTDRWGRRRFAYEINHKHEGYYVVLEVATEASNLDELDRVLRLADQVVRHKILRLPDKEAERRGLLEQASA
jgi:small subunit ribosomal protein S6